jgi:hypothetical protein
VVAIRELAVGASKEGEEEGDTPDYTDREVIRYIYSILYSTR